MIACDDPSECAPRQAIHQLCVSERSECTAQGYRRKPIFEPFRTIERVFAWEDKFRRLQLRFERISGLHYAFKTLAYTMINLRHYCQI